MNRRGFLQLLGGAAAAQLFARQLAPHEVAPPACWIGDRIGDMWVCAGSWR